MNPEEIPELINSDDSRYRLANLCLTEEALQATNNRLAKYGIPTKTRTYEDVPLDSFHCEISGRGTVFAVYAGEPTQGRRFA